MEIEILVKKALNLKKYPIAQLISILESTNHEALSQHTKIFSALARESSLKAVTLGWTGTPGAGKSSLLGKTVEHLLREVPSLSIGILAVDPSSAISGGAILGDRTRTRFPLKDERVFFRSQASDLSMGGLGKHTWPVVRFMEYVFDIVFVETVGIGQNETDIKHLSDFTYLIMQPFAGDQIQFMKAGIMEIPDAFIINKCDEEAQAKQSYHQLEASLEIFHTKGVTQNHPPIFLTSALTTAGIEELAEHIKKIPLAPKKIDGTRDEWFLRSEMKNEFGAFGFQHYRDDPEKTLSYEQKKSKARNEILAAMRNFLCKS